MLGGLKVSKKGKRNVVSLNCTSSFTNVHVKIRGSNNTLEFSDGC